MRSDTINELIDSFRDILINRTDFKPDQVHTAATLLRTILTEPTPEKPPASYKEAFNKSERKAIEKLRQESDAFDKLVIEEMSKTSANEKQVGGKHYKIAIEPWDFILANDLGFLEGNAIKYIVRHKQKNGIQDISKAIHYLEKLKEHELERLERETK